jgi:hypothetical protein
MPVFGLSPEFLTPRPKKEGVEPIMFGGEGAEGAPLKELKKAKEMATAGKPAEEVFIETKTPKTTGWFQGGEGDWRFEFDDSKSTVNPQAFANLHKGQPVQIEQLFSHPELFQYYPQLKNVKLQALTPQEEKQGVLGSFNQATNTLKVGRNIDEAKATLIHELQHMIQRREGFGAGGGDAAPTLSATINQSSRVIDAVLEAGKAKEKIEQEFAPRLQAAIKGSGEDFEKVLAERSAAWAKVDEAVNKLKKERDAINAKANEMKRTLSNYQIYQRLGGETEARNAETRMMMDLLTRQRSIPTETQEFPYEEQLISKSK